MTSSKNILKFPSKIKFSFVSLLLIFVCISNCFSFGNSIPKLTGRVVDNANVINGKTQDEIEEYLHSVEIQTGIQIAVLTVKSIPTTIEEYALEVFEEWKLGQAKKDNGVLLLISVDDRKLRIEVGYGLEGTLTDTKSGIIIRTVIAPYFKNGDYSKGIFEGVKTIALYASGDEQTVKKIDGEEQSSNEENIPPIPIIMFLMFIGFIIFMNITHGGRGGPRGPRGPIIFPGGGFGGHSGGGFGGGGGFSGGGGRSGGGGASGGW